MPRSARLATLVPFLLLAVTQAGPPLESVPPAGDDPAARQPPATTVAGEELVSIPMIDPVRAIDSLRPPVTGRWQPNLLPPNDLTDPPNRYRNAVGGACVGMCAVTHGFWTAEVEDYTLELERAADVFIRNMVAVPGGDGRPVMPNHPLPGWVVVDGRVRALENKSTLVRIAENVQNRLQPGGGVEKSPVVVRRSHEEVRRYAGRITSVRDLGQRIARAGGRLVVGAVHFNEPLTKSSGHAFVLTVDERGEVFVWDPNARMTEDSTGSGRLAPLRYDLVDTDHFSAIRYEIVLPDGTKQARVFEFLFPITSFVPAEKIPPLPRSR